MTANKIYLLFLFWLCVSSVSAADSQPTLTSSTGVGSICNETTARAADDLASNISTWADARRFYRNFKTCDDGGIAESLADVFGRILAGPDPQISALAQEARHTPGFEEFILRHLDETTSREDMLHIANDLPKLAACMHADAKKLCANIKAAAENALGAE